jgi:hypothetical protein
MKFSQIFNYLEESSIDYRTCQSEPETKSFLIKGKKYLYLIVWSEKASIYSWGTTIGGSGNRIRKSSIFNSKLTGKYDRRVDYLMLKILYGSPTIYLFETIDNPTIIESRIKNINGTMHCYYGLTGNNRVEISKEIFIEFKQTDHYSCQSKSVKEHFEEYFSEVFLANRKHPNNPKRTFCFGDSLEPKFLRVIDKQHLEEAIKIVLNVRFYKN